MTTTTGAALIAQGLKQQGVDYMFGIVGFPVYGVAHAAQQAGIEYYGFRNEQAASYAAGAVGYLTGRPGACLAVSGPGMVHGIAGLANAEKNCWPMVLLGGANDRYQNGQGAFQECPQVEAARPFSKYSAEIDAAHRAPFYVEQAVRTSIYGRPGASYLNLTNDVLTAQVDEEDVEFPPRCPEPPTSLADPRDVERAVAVLREAKNPLVIVGKGAAYARAEERGAPLRPAHEPPRAADADGQGRRLRRRSPPGRSGALLRSPERGRDPADRRPPQLDPPLRAAAAFQEGRPGAPDRPSTRRRSAPTCRPRSGWSATRGR